MQTLVYENYSKFIDATDAIKSIGINVSSINGSGNGNAEGGQEEEEENARSGEQDNNITDKTNNNNNGLHRLITGMERIQQSSFKSEQLLHASREAVAEKLRIQRLLTRRHSSQ